MNKPKILIVDDDLQIQTLIAGILKDHGYDVVQADNGEDAVEMAEKESPALILLDIKMPKKDGISACQEIKADSSTAHIPIIMLSSAGQMEEIQKAMANGAVTYITKPCDQKTLLDVIDAHLPGKKPTSWLKLKRKP